jgi:hypothetical protein
MTDFTCRDRNEGHIVTVRRVLKLAWIFSVSSYVVLYLCSVLIKVFNVLDKPFLLKLK